ncbi:MAG: type VI secretion system protein TssL [Mesorhizobium amorphae]|nr:MAG: type VI secretion system protein TssL [Mesorhizobium amorphae]
MSAADAAREGTTVAPTAEAQRRAALASGLADVFDELGQDRPHENNRAVSAERFEKLLSEFRLGGGLPAIVTAAGPLLALAHALREAHTEPDMEGLRTLAIAAVRDYERDLAGARIAPERARAAHYVVCATIDDVVLSQPWGVQGGWARSGLVSTFHMDVTGGDRVFDLLDHFHRNPGANKDILFLIYLCLSLAFEGRTRVSPRGTLELMQVRDGLYRTLRGQFGDFERELSPHWRGVSARHKPLRNWTALWALLAALVLVLAIGYLLFTLALNRASDTTLAGFAGAVAEPVPSLAAVPDPDPPTEVAEATVSPPVDPTPDAPPPTEQPPQRDAIGEFAAFLQPEVDQNLVGLTRDGNSVLIRIRNTGLFETGSAAVDPDFQSLLTRIGTAIAQENFRAVVIGHTDDVPIRTAQYPSNWHLSQARAEAVAKVLEQYAGPGAITFEGRAENQPVADNATEEGREANRRTEILVIGAGARAAEAPTPGANGEAQP